MTMLLNKITDPRDNLEKARLKELIVFAHKQGVTGIQPTMPAQLVRRILRVKGLVDITIPDRPLGGIKIGDGPVQSTPDNTVEVMAEDDLMKQWLRDQGNHVKAAPATPEVADLAEEIEGTLDKLPDLEAMDALYDASLAEDKPKPKRGINEITRLRQECKARGIKMKRTDKMSDLRAKLDGTDTPNSSQ